MSFFVFLKEIFSFLEFKLTRIFPRFFFFFRFILILAKTSRLLLECSKLGRWFLLLYSHAVYYVLLSNTTLNPFIYLLITWFFLQYQLAIFLVTAILPPSSSLSTTSKCPICSLHFSDRFHHCFLVNRCIAICNVHCFLAFTFYATLSTCWCFYIFLEQFFSVASMRLTCLLPLGEFLCSNLTWKQSGLVMLTRSTIMGAGAAGVMGVYVGKEFYYDQIDRSRSIWREIFKILFPVFSVIHHH